MAVELALGLLGPVIELGKLVARPIGRQFNYLCCFASNIKSLNDEAKKLNDALIGLEEEVERKSNNLEEPVGEVKTWIENSKKTIKEINEINEKATSAESGCLKLGARFDISKKAKKKVDSIGLLLGQKPKAEFHPGPIAATQAVQLGKIFECESRKKVEEDIMTTLRDGVPNMIGICGMGGIGKTTMAEKIMKKVREEGVFDEVVIATVSRNIEISKVQNEIGRQLGLEKLKEETSDTVRKQLLHDRLRKDTKRTLLVLDDVWEQLELSNFGIPCDSKACRILITSRDEDVLKRMYVHKIFGMEILPQEEAWSFFRDIVGTCVDEAYLKLVAKEIVKKCSGLTIALKLVGVALKPYVDDARIWKDTLRDMEQCDRNGVMEKVYTPLRWSYDFLSSENGGSYAQSLFLLCCLFPEDAEIPLEYLTCFCMGLGIFEGITELEDARNKMAKLTKILKSRSLLLNGEDEDHVRMHDVVRDVCIYIAKEKRYIGGSDCTWISSSQLVGNRNELVSGPNVHLLFLNHRYDPWGFIFDSAMLEEIRELYVLCIEDNYSLTKLPHPTLSLRKLNTLILGYCDELETITVVGELVHLEILIIRDCIAIKELPSEVMALVRLKLLEVTGCRKLQSIGRGIISSLVHLEELKMTGSFNQWEDRKNAGLRELEALKKLTCLEIEIEDSALAAENIRLSSKIERFFIKIGEVYFERSEFKKQICLHLEGETSPPLADWIEMQLLRNAECLRLIGHVDLGRGDNIKWLEWNKSENVKNVVRTSMFDDAPMFISIEHLELSKLPQLQEICCGPISSCSFKNLKKLKIENCEALMHFWRSSNLRQSNNVPLFINLSSIIICDCDGLQNLGQLSIAGKDCLPELAYLRIESCKMIEQVFLWNGRGADESKNNNVGVPHQNCHVTKVFLKLREVNLNKLPNLTTFYKGIEGIEFPLGMQMMIRECPNMKSIIGSSNNADIDHHYSHVFCQSKQLELLFGSQEVLDVADNPFGRHEIIPSSLFNGLEVLKIRHFERNRKSVFTVSMAANLVSLRELSISSCYEIIKVFEDEDAASGGKKILLLPKLEKLELTNLPKLASFCEGTCDEIIYVIEDEDAASGGKKILLLPKLKKLQLQDLPKLASFCKGTCEVELPSLREVEILLCPCIKEDFSLGVAPNFRAFKTDLNTYFGVGIGIGVSFSGLKELVINWNEYPFYDHKISVSLFSGLEKLQFFEFKAEGMRLFSCSVAESLVNLRALDIVSCYGLLVNIIEDDERQLMKGDEKVASSIVLFPKLEELSLYELPFLMSFCEWKCNVELPSLRKVFIAYCAKMEKFSSGILATPNLEILEMEDRDIGPTKDLNGELHLQFVSNKVPSDSRLYDIKIDYNPFRGHELIPSSICNGLEVLTIQNYEGSMSFFTLSVARNLVGLRELFIYKCDEMIRVIEDEEVAGGGERILIFHKLEKLQLKNLPKLESFCEWKCEVELPSLRKVLIVGCPEMRNFSLGVAAAPNLEAFTTNFTTYVGLKELNGALQQAREKEKTRGGARKKRCKEEAQN